MLRVALLLILFVFFARAFWRLLDGVIEGMTGAPRRPLRPARMVRDPICGTFLLQERAVTIVERALEVYGPPVYVRRHIVHNDHDDARRRYGVLSARFERGGASARPPAS